MLKPLLSNIVVEPIKVAKTDGGIYIPEIAQERSVFGKVIAIGPGAFNREGVRIPMSVSVGDTVMFDRSSVNQFMIGQKLYYMISESDVIGVKE